MNKIKTVDGFTFPLTFTDSAGYLYEAYHDEKGFWFKAVESGNIYHEHRWDFDVFKHYIDTNDWNIVSESTQTDPLVTIKQSEYDDLISEINALQELVKELSAPQDTTCDNTFKPISEYTLEDWKQACVEDWEFECRDGDVVQIINVDEEDVTYPVKGTDNYWRDVKGFWYTGRTDSGDIVKRIR